MIKGKKYIKINKNIGLAHEKALAIQNSKGKYIL